MWARIKRIFRAIIGSFIDLAEDPEMILQQNIRDMRDKVPEMNTGIAKAKAGIIRLEAEQKQYEDEIRSHTARVKACLLSGNEGLAAEYALKLKQTQEALERNKMQHEQASKGYEALLKLKEKYMHEMKRKTEDAQKAIEGARAAKWKSELAGVFEQFEVADVDSTHQEMMDKLNEKSTLAEGKLAMAVESIDMKSLDMEKKAQEIEGQELLKQFKIDLGIKPTEAAAAPVSAPVQADPIKTIGPEKAKTQ